MAKQGFTDFHEFSLTKSEVEDRKNELVEELNNNDRLVAEFATASSRYKGLLKGSAGKIEKLRGAINEGKELIEVEIFVNSPKNGKKTFIRQDNNKKIVLDMTQDEIDQHKQIGAFDEVEE